MGRHNNATWPADGDGVSGPCRNRTCADPGANPRRAKASDGSWRAARHEAEAHRTSSARGHGATRGGREPDGYRAQLQRQPFDHFEAARGDKHMNATVMTLARYHALKAVKAAVLRNQGHRGLREMQSAELTRLATAHLTAHPEIVVRARKIVRDDPAL